MKMSPEREQLEKAYERCRHRIHDSNDRNVVWLRTWEKLNERVRTQRYQNLLEDPEVAVDEILERVFLQLDSSKGSKTFWQQPNFDRFFAYIVTSMNNAGISQKNRLRRFFNLMNLTGTSTEETRFAPELEEHVSRGVLTRIGDDERREQLRHILHLMVEDRWISADERDISIRLKVDKWARRKIAKKFGLQEDREVSDTWTKVQPIMERFVANGLNLNSRGGTR